MHWTAAEVISKHAHNVLLWFKQDNKSTYIACLLWIIYEDKKALCTLYDATRQPLKSAHRLDADTMAAYLNRYVATAPIGGMPT